MNLFIITTYNTPNLIISLSALRRYLENNRLNRFCLTVHNDSPAYTVSESLVYRYLPEHLLEHLLIVNPNENKNLGHFHARMRAIMSSYEYFVNKKNLVINFFMFIDDDDVILNPDFSSNKIEISHRAVVVKRLLEVLTLIENPNPNIQFNKFIEYEEWKMGNVGVPYNLNLYYKFLQHLSKFTPKICELYGSNKIGEPDDIIYMNLWHVWLRHYVNPNLEELIDKKDCFSYALTYLEDRRGRYEVPEGVVDLRYGKEWDGKTTYQSIVQPIINAYEKYIRDLGD